MKRSAKPILPPWTVSVSIRIGTFSPAAGGGPAAAATAVGAEVAGASAPGGPAGEAVPWGGASPSPSSSPGGAGLPTTRWRLVVPSDSIVTSHPIPARASRDTSRNIGLYPAFIPSAEKLSHFKKSRFVDRSTARSPATSARPAYVKLALPPAHSLKRSVPPAETVPRASVTLK